MKSTMKVKHLISPTRWKAFIVGIWRSYVLGVSRSRKYEDFKLKLEASDKSDYYVEQVLQRAYTCEPCLIAGECHLCGCDTPGLFLAEDTSCEDKKWGPMVSESIWKFQKQNNVKN